MHNYFDDVISGDIFNTDDVITEDETLLEAYEPNSVPYMRLINKKIYLPAGMPAGIGNLCFLYTPNVEASFRIMKDNTNFDAKSKYRLYYITPKYKGKIKSTLYRQNIIKERRNIYIKLKQEVGFVRGYPKNYIDAGENKNLYYDLSRYLSIFKDISASKKFPPKIKIQLYWEYLASLLNNPIFKSYTNKLVLINVNDYALSGDWKDNLDNPLYLIYYTAFKYGNMSIPIDMDFYFYNGMKTLKINPSKITNKDCVKLKNLMNRVYANTSINHANAAVTASALMDKITDDKIIAKAEVGETSVNKVMELVSKDDKVVTFDKDPVKSTAVSSVAALKDISTEAIEDSIREKVEEAQEEAEEINAERPEGEKLEGDDLEEYIDQRTEEKINQDQQLLSDIYDKTSKSNLPTPPVMSARDKMLKDKQKERKVKDITIKDLQNIHANHIPLPPKDVSNKLHTINEHMGTIKFNNFEKEYNKRVLPKDIVNCFLALNNKPIPMYLRDDIKVEDTSDELNYKETYTVQLEDANRKRHTIKVDIPKFVDDKFLYIGGSKKRIKWQSLLCPVAKIGENRVLVATSYNKMTITRVDTKSLGSIERLEKLLKKNDKATSYFKTGTRFKSNAAYITTVEYDELSKIFVKFKSGKCTIFFDQSEAHEYAAKHNIKIGDNVLFIGTDSKGDNIFIDIETQVSVSNKKRIIDVIVDCFSDDIKAEYEAIKPPRRLMYGQVMIMKKDIPIGPLLCFWEGLSTVIKKLGVEHRVSNSIKDIAPDEAFLKFSDCYLIYKDEVKSSLILNGLRLLETNKIEFASMDTMEPYLNYFSVLYGRVNVSNAFLNFYDFTMDPITVELLEDMNLPTDLVELMIYAVSLLADSQYTSELDAKLSRYRSNEIIAAILYDNLAKSYNNFRIVNGTKKFSIPRDCVMKDLLGLSTVEEHSTLNPILEMQSTHASSVKGFRGVNENRAFTIQKRSYDQSMAGIITPGANPDGSIGITRYLSLEPTITSLRGYVETHEGNKVNELSTANIFGPSELSIPIGAMIDDPTRLGHAARQSGHVIPVVNSSPVLVSNGFEEAAKFHLSSDFVVMAEEDGEVAEIDEKNSLLIVKYKSGKARAVDLKGQIVKNGGGGFFLSNHLVSDLKVGDKVKANDVIAYHKDFFTNTKNNNCRLNVGTMAKVAIMSTYNTYEDGTFITEKLSRDAATEMCFLKQAVVGKNSNILYMVKEGDHVAVGDPLIQFDLSFDEKELGDLFHNLDPDQEDEALTNSKNTIPSKYSGTIESIKMYSPYDLEELSPSLQKIFRAYYSKINARKKILEKYEPDSKDTIVKCGLLFNETTKKIEPNRFGAIKGQKVPDSVLIEIYIKHAEPLEVGSKISNYTGLKNTIGEIIPAGYEPWSEFRPDEEISSIIAPNSILKRMTPSIIVTAFTNKIVIELKRRLQEIYES